MHSPLHETPQVTETLNENRSMPEDNRSCFYLTNVALERVDECIDEDLSFSIADLWVRDMEDLTHGKCYPLVNITPSRWEVKGAIEMPRRVREIRWEVHSANEQTYSIVDADCTVGSLRGTQSKAYRKSMEGIGKSGSMAISWDFAIEWESGSSSENYGLAAHINACICEGCIHRLGYTPKVLETLQSALRLTPMSHPSIMRCFVKLTREHQRSFQLDRDPSRLDDAISTLSRALERTPRSDSGFPSHLEGLARLLVLRFGLSSHEDLSPLNQAISELQRAVELTIRGSKRLPYRLGDLGELLFVRFKHGGDLSDLSDALDAQIKTLELRTGHHPHLKSLSLESFEEQVDTLFHDTQALSSVCDAEQIGKSPSRYDVPHLLRVIGNSFWLRFRSIGKFSDRSAAISAQRLLVCITPEGHPDASTFLADLGTYLLNRFQDQEEIRDVDEAISAYQRSVNAPCCDPSDHSAVSQHPCCMMYWLGVCFWSKYKVTRNRDDLDEAISTFQRMVYIDPGDVTHPCSVAWLNSLSESFAALYMHTHDRRDISEAISVQERLVQRTQGNDKAYGKNLRELAQLLKLRFCGFGNLDDIEKAISFGRIAVRMSSGDPCELADRLETLAVCLTHKVKGPAATVYFSPLPRSVSEEDTHLRLTGSLALDHLNEAIQLLRKAVDLFPLGGHSHPSLLDELAGCLHHRFHRAHNSKDIQEALKLQTRSVSLTPDGNSMVKSSYTAHLANLHLCRYHHTGDEDDREEMVKNWKASFALPARTAGDTFAKAVDVARHCLEEPTTIAAFDTAIDAAALMVGLDQTVVQRYSRIHDMSGMPLEAASTAFQFSRPDKAVEWLEHGRCVVWSQLNKLRTPLGNLHAHSPQLATDIADVSRRLERAGSTRPLVDYHMSEFKKLSLDEKARAHAKLSRRWEDLLIKARAIPGFESFLKPVPCSALIEHLPSSGNIVVVNAHTRRCDAIALVAGLGEPLHIPLPDFTISKAMEYRSILNKKLSALGFRTQGAEKVESDEGETAERGAGRYRAKDRNVLYVLKALWIEVVKPILDALAIPKADDPSVSGLHRIWWCPTGVLSFLPLHAAGMYSDVGSESVLDYVVSSYTPSISSLLERVKDDRRADETVSGLFLTNQPKVPGYQRIAGATKEVNSVHQIATERGIRVLKVEGSELSVDDCLKHMEEYSSVHFACHGHQNADEPLQSRLRLETGALELGAIMQKDLKNADFAFLSACQTSTGEEKLDNEAVHLAAGMLAAGYRRVVATMWEIWDSHAANVARDFYLYLWDHRDKDSGSRFDGSLSAHALHHAIRQLRERLDATREVRGIPEDLETSLLIWIPYVHFGY